MRNQLILFFKDNRRGRSNLLRRLGSPGSMQRLRRGGHAGVVSLIFFSFLSIKCTGTLFSARKNIIRDSRCGRNVTEPVLYRYTFPLVIMVL